jgi:ubiquinone/menaquinone biosynthesis C-methylase UbiE
MQLAFTPFWDNWIMDTKLPGFFEGTGMPDPGWWEALWSDPAGVLSAVGVKPGMDVIDLCSGDGWFTLQIARIARRVVSVDIDGKLLKTAKARLTEGGVTNCTFVESNAYDIGKMGSGWADHVFMANAFHGVPDGLRLARAVQDVLKPGGLFAIVNWHARPREETPVLGEPRGPATEQRMTPEATIEAMAKSGMNLAEIIEIPPYHYAALFRR